MKYSTSRKFIVIEKLYSFKTKLSKPNSSEKKFFDE